MTEEKSAANRPNVNAARLSNGEPAWPVAERNGISRTAFRMRLARGNSPDEAATAPLVVRDNRGPKPPNTVGGKFVHRTSDGRLARDVALEGGISIPTFQARIQRGWTVDEATGLVPAPRKTGRPAAAMGGKVLHRTSDGRPAVEVAKAQGIAHHTWKARLRIGWTVDQAVGLVPPPNRPRGRKAKV